MKHMAVVHCASDLNCGKLTLIFYKSHCFEMGNAGVHRHIDVQPLLKFGKVKSNENRILQWKVLGQPPVTTSFAYNR